MSSLADQFEQVLNGTLDPLRKNHGLPASSGAAAGWWRLKTDGSWDGNIVYVGEVQCQGPSQLIAAPNDDTLWEIGSTSKTTAAALLVQYAAANGGLLDEKVLQYIDAWLPRSDERPALLADATFESLVTMSAGWAKNDAGGAVSNLFDNLLKVSTYPGTPGTWLYSNLAFAVIGYAMTQVYGVAPSDTVDLPSVYMSLLRDQLFTPLKIDTTWQADADRRQLPYGWNRGDSGYTQTDGNNPSWPANDPAGGLTMTAPNLQLWLQANMVANSTLSSQVLADMRAELQSTGGNSNEGQWMGRGWFRKNFTLGGSTRQMVNKNGLAPGFEAGVGYLGPLVGTDDATAGVLCAFNATGVSPSSVNVELLQTVLADPDTAPPN